MSLARKYQRKIYRHYKMLTIWPIGTPLELGDIVEKVKGVYRRTSNLKEIDPSIEIAERKDVTSDNEEFDDKGSVIISAKLKGDAAIPNTSIGLNDAGALVEFESKNSVYLKAIDINYKSIEDQIGLGNKIIDLFGNGNWDKDWFIITELAQAKSGTIILSKSTDAKIEIKAKAAGTIEEIDLANAELKLSVGFNKGIGAKTIAEEGLTPLFRVSGIKFPWFGDPIFGATVKKREFHRTPKKVLEDPSIVRFRHLSGEDLFENDDEDMI